jgi:phosphate transport system permease protein
VSTTSTTVPTAGPVSGSRSFFFRLRNGDEVAHLVTFLFAASVVFLTVLLVFELWTDSALSRHKFGFNFFRTSVWDPIFEQFGALPFIYGTLVTAGVALFIAVPLGIGAAIFLAELAPARVSDTLEFFIDLLAAVPSVIYGVLGVFIVIPLMRLYIQPALKSTLGFLPLFQGPAYGVGFLTAGMVLAIMVLPYIISVSREVLLSVPRDGNPPGRSWSRLHVLAFSAPSFWRLPELLAKPWPSLW